MASTTRKPRARGNGEGTAFKRGRTWTAQITLWTLNEDGTKRRSYRTKGGFKFKRDALAYIDELRNGPARDSDITFKGLYDLWSAERYPKVTRDTENGYKAAYAKCGALVARRFAGLNAADLQKAIDEAKTLPKKKKDGTITEPRELTARGKSDMKSLFSNMYKYALKNDYVTKDYSEFVTVPKKKKPVKDAFTDSEIETLWKDYNAGNGFTGYILIMIYTGMRYGEISIIKKENIYLAERYMIGGIKTDAGTDREIPINEKIYPIVEKFYHANDKKLLEMHEKVFYNSFYATLSRLEMRKLNPHCCRHTFFTLMANAGIQPAVITETGGHEDYSTTMGYTHIRLSKKIEAVNKI